MKLKAIVIAAFFALGVLTSVAVAKGPPPGKGPGSGKGNGNGKKEQTVSTSSTGATTTTGDKHSAKKIWICHKTGSGKWVKMRINKKAWPAHKAHGDAALEAEPGSTTSGTTSTATTGTTTTSGKSKGAGSCAGLGSGGSTTTSAP